MLKFNVFGYKVVMSISETRILLLTHNALSPTFSPYFVQVSESYLWVRYARSYKDEFLIAHKLKSSFIKQFEISIFWSTLFHSNLDFRKFLHFDLSKIFSHRRGVLKDEFLYYLLHWRSQNLKLIVQFQSGFRSVSDTGWFFLSF